MKKCLLVAALALIAGFASAQITDTIVSLTPSNKNVVLEEFTGVNCGYCPDGHRIVNEIAAAHPGRVFPINIHTGSYAVQYQTDFGAAIANQTGLTGYPAGTVNRHVFSGSNTALNRGEFSSKSNQIMNQASPVNIAAEGTLDFTTRTLNLRVQIYYTANAAESTNLLNVAVLQDNILGPQSGMSSNPAQVVGTQYNHQHMLRDMITGQWGETIESTTAGTLIEKNYTYVVPEQLGKTGQKIEALLEDLSFIVFVTETHQEILTGVKANITGINMPAINSRISLFKEIPLRSCDDQVAAYVQISNLGQNPVSELQLQYKVASGSYQTFTWHGNIPSMGSDTIHLPIMNVSTNANQNIYVSITGVNGENFASTEKSIQVKKFVYTGGGWMLLEIKTDNYGTETTFKMFDPNGTVVMSGGPFTNSSIVHQFAFTPQTTGCYRLEVYDSYGDGINNGYGTGYIKLFDAAGATVFSHNGKFDDVVGFNLDVTAPVGIEENVLNNSEIHIFPNPATSTIRIESEETVSHVEMFNLQGQLVLSESGDVKVLNINNLTNGIYMVKITTPSGVTTQKIVKQ